MKKRLLRQRQVNMAADLPKAFLERMQEQLKDEYADFVKSYEKAPRRGIRINTLKTTSDELTRRAPFGMEPVPWVKNGYYIPREADPAGHAFYRAGLYYIQEPSAMTPADRLPVEPGDRVLDLCAAPGGKATALAAKLNNEGLLVANDVSASRCRALLHNIELAGAQNVIVTNTLPQNLERKFPGFFDKIMVDAPCSGEGMFRKEPAVADAWSLEKVEYFAKQQRSILKSAVAMLKPGGYMMYSTCTFSPLEDEGSVSFVLEEYPEMELTDIDWYSGFSKGVPEWGNDDESLRKTARIWPHKMDGEGHFLALFRKNADGTTYGAPGMNNYLSTVGNPYKKGGRRKKNTKSGMNASFSAEDKKIFEDFIGKLDNEPERERLENRNGKVYLEPFGSDMLGGIRFLRNGLYIGDIKKNRFEPSQAFALSLSGSGYENAFSFDEADRRLFGYFRGEPVQLDETEEQSADGIILIKAGGFPVGFGKKKGNIIKSRYIFLK